MQGSPLDAAVVAELRSLSAPGEDLLAEVVAVFRDDAPRQIRDLHAALAARDAGGVQRTAHRLKGTANGVGARAMGSAAAAIESAARAGDLDGAVAAAQGLDDLFHTASAALEREVDRRT